MNKEKILKAISNVMWSREVRGFSNDDIRRLLNGIEKEYPQEVIIKTNLCKGCSKLSVEVWIKECVY